MSLTSGVRLAVVREGGIESCEGEMGWRGFVGRARREREREKIRVRPEERGEKKKKTRLG